MEVIQPMTPPRPRVDHADILAYIVTETLRARYLGTQAQAIYLIRPDQVVAARWVSTDAAAVSAALADIWEGR